MFSYFLIIYILLVIVMLMLLLALLMEDYDIDEEQDESVRKAFKGAYGAPFYLATLGSYLFQHFVEQGSDHIILSDGATMTDVGLYMYFVCADALTFDLVTLLGLNPTAGMISIQPGFSYPVLIISTTKALVALLLAKLVILSIKASNKSHA